MDELLVPDPVGIAVPACGQVCQATVPRAIAPELVRWGLAQAAYVRRTNRFVRVPARWFEALMADRTAAYVAGGQTWWSSRATMERQLAICQAYALPLAGLDRATICRHLEGYAREEGWEARVIAQAFACVTGHGWSCPDEVPCRVCRALRRGGWEEADRYLGPASWLLPDLLRELAAADLVTTPRTKDDGQHPAAA